MKHLAYICVGAGGILLSVHALTLINAHPTLEAMAMLGVGCALSLLSVFKTS